MVSNISANKMFDALVEYIKYIELVEGSHGLENLDRDTDVFSKDTLKVLLKAMKVIDA
jgi:hypothetical protein